MYCAVLRIVLTLRTRPWTTLQAQPEAYCSNITWYGSHGCHTKNNQVRLFVFVFIACACFKRVSNVLQAAAAHDFKEVNESVVVGQMCLYLPDVKPLDGFLSFDNAGVAVTVVLIVMLQQVRYDASASVCSCVIMCLSAFLSVCMCVSFSVSVSECLMF